jgi:hypothetical protein
MGPFSNACKQGNEFSRSIKMGNILFSRETINLSQTTLLRGLVLSRNVLTFILPPLLLLYLYAYVIIVRAFVNIL